MNTQEQERLIVLNQVSAGQLTAAQAAALVGVSVRQIRRILAAYRKEGAAAVAHGNRGRAPRHTVGQEIRETVVVLATTTYAGVNQQHLSELLAEREGIVLSRSTVRRILAAAGQASPRPRRAPQRRQRRDRYPQEGMLVQIDGSRHRWLEERGPMLTLLAGIDDAPGTVPAALFREQEDAHGYFLLLRQIVATHGRPVALYRDRHGIFARTAHDPETLAEQLAGTREPTQFGRLLEELAITSIGAHSPQAKGRIERVFGTFQDRLVVELRLANARTRTEADAVLASFLPRFNARFAVPPAEDGVAYRPLAPDLDPDTIFCFKYPRTVAADNTVQFGTHRLQVRPSTDRLSWAHARVEVHERLDGSLAVYHHGQCLATTPAPVDAPTLRARKGPRARPTGPAAGAEVGGPPTSAPAARRIPSPTHPWRKSWRRSPEQSTVTKSLNT